MGDLFAVTVNPLELVVRGSVIYLGLVFVVRFLLRRDVGSMSMADILFVVLVADAAQNAMAGEYKSLADGGVLVATLAGWNVVLDWLGYRSRVFRRLLEPPALPLIRNGDLLRQNLKKEWITADEVHSKLREAGVDDIKDVRLACLEPSGELSVVRVDRKEPPGPSRRRMGAA